MTNNAGARGGALIEGVRGIEVDEVGELEELMKLAEFGGRPNKS